MTYHLNATIYLSVSTLFLNLSLADKTNNYKDISSTISQFSKLKKVSKTLHIKSS